MPLIHHHQPLQLLWWLRVGTGSSGIAVVCVVGPLLQQGFWLLGFWSARGQGLKLENVIGDTMMLSNVRRLTENKKLDNRVVHPYCVRPRRSRLVCTCMGLGECPRACRPFSFVNGSPQHAQ
ncbi:hypothetical protein GGTG_05734 [Gaeumannomyces tritici R3-111a-1]|uniref:Uncharacterized protein n=1 Tax=Gaeumannomyces tritici (strain R3-111a-1) TaxID=644352 RepID=J3NWS3_GAET3|nr:hypothetical protein GGTG_05734 [Gaeumannomyces tritici R3-111a-1]EJT75805.1 hypothetical protein GGTG_05734 [Gaeumannomyces tritici R3-111a-1]